MHFSSMPRVTALLSLLGAFSGVTKSQSTPTTTATATAATYTVNSNPGTGEYGTITAAINALPADSQPKVILVRGGVYNEQISITRNGKVTLIGDTTFPNDFTQNTVTVQFSNGQLTSLGKDETTPVIYAKKSNDNSGLAVYNINFNNTYPQTPNTAALAADFYGQNIAAYGCAFIGFQDTLLANKGLQVFSNCYIEGSIDYVWGFSTAYFHQCYIATNTPGACISAQSRASTTSPGGYVFDTCQVTYTSTYGTNFGQSFLGRPYSNCSIAVYMNSWIEKHIAPAGWHIWSTTSPQTSNVTFGEFNNAGPGSWQANTPRVSFATNFTASQAAPYQLTSWVGDTSWLDMTAYNYEPSYNLSGPATASPIPPLPAPTSTSASTSSSTSATPTSAPTSTSTSTSSGSSSISSTTTSTTVISTTSTTTSTFAATATNAHPDSGTVPPSGAVIVDGTGNHGGFTSLTAALASLPADSTNQTIFMYSGTYQEQAPGINRPGPTRIIGYQSGNPGAFYQNNTVVLSWSRGLSVSPLPSGHSDAETATFTATSNTIALYNIDIVNTDNLNGTVANYVTLAGSIYGSQVGFYACSFIGWQDTLLTGTKTGYQYYENSYIEGAIDFIWGYSNAYFKGCTIAAKRSGSCITAQSRASFAAVGGYVFDQCLITAAPDASTNLTNKVYLGRPYSAYARVIYKYSYLDSVINPTGWKIWSATDPRTDNVTFAEFNNTGPSAWQYNDAARQAFGNSTLLTYDNYTLSDMIPSTYWIDMTYFNTITTPMLGNAANEGVPIVTMTTTQVNEASTTVIPSAVTIVETLTSSTSTTDIVSVTADTATSTTTVQATTTLAATATAQPVTSTASTTTTFVESSTENDFSTTTVSSTTFVFEKTTTTVLTTKSTPTITKKSQVAPATTTSTEYQTRTKKTTVTLSCIPTSSPTAAVKRDVFNRVMAVKEWLQRRDATITVTQYTTQTTVDQTFTAPAPPGVTTSTTSTAIDTETSTTTATPSPVIISTTSFETDYSTSTVDGSTIYTTLVTTLTSGTTTTPPASLTTVSGTTTITADTKTVTTKKTITPPAVTVTSTVPQRTITKISTSFTTTTSTFTVTMKHATTCGA